MCIRDRVKIVGKGTEALSLCRKGDRIKILGPLGKGFSFSEGSPFILVAGGIGLPPIYFAYTRIRSLNIDYKFLYGAKTKEEIVSNKILNIPEKKLTISTDDGSYGIKGTVIDVLKKELGTNSYPETTKILGCGPFKMLKEINILSLKHNIDSEISLETIMGCGFGVCQGCAIKVKENNLYTYNMICKDGPVFNSKKIVWE